MIYAGLGVSEQEGIVMQIARWGNSCAVRIPVDVMAALGLKVGDTIKLRPAADGFIDVVPDDRKRAALARIRAMRVPLPADYKFDREEANAR